MWKHYNIKSNLLLRNLMTGVTKVV
nr:unnamed protein product [Callosobruchus chinensis]